MKRGGISPASRAQRAKVREALSVVSSRPGCDPAHLWPRSKGGCNHPDCVVALTRDEHDAFDRGQLDILPSLIARECWDEMAHPISVHHVSPQRLVERLTGRSA